jgi:hypothetical protein
VAVLVVVAVAVAAVVVAGVLGVAVGWMRRVRSDRSWSPGFLKIGLWSE